jgi:hypothetical protein
MAARFWRRPRRLSIGRFLCKSIQSVETDLEKHSRVRLRLRNNGPARVRSANVLVQRDKTNKAPKIMNDRDAESDEPTMGVVLASQPAEARGESLTDLIDRLDRSSFLRILDLRASKRGRTKPGR